MRSVDLTAADGGLLAPCCAGCAWWLTAPGAVADPGLRRRWEQKTEAEFGCFGRVLVEGDAVIGWMQVAPSHLIARARHLPAGPPSPDACLLTCAYFRDEGHLHGFRLLLQEVEAALRHRRVPALEAFGIDRAPAGASSRGYLRRLNLFNPDVLEGAGFQRVQRKGPVVRFRLDLATLVETPRHGVAWRRMPAPAGTPLV